VEQAATLGDVVGIEWFTLVDQSATGRFFEKGTWKSANARLRTWKKAYEGKEHVQEMGML
jgi:hypothetical protein